MIDLFIFIFINMTSFLQEIQQLRASLPAKLQTERNLRDYEQTQKNLLRQRLLAMDDDAIEEYYQRYKNRLRDIADKKEELHLLYTFDENRFDPIHQIIIQKFQQDGIEAFCSGRGFVRGFWFRNIH